MTLFINRGDPNLVPTVVSGRQTGTEAPLARGRCENCLCQYAVGDHAGQNDGEAGDNKHVTRIRIVWAFFLPRKKAQKKLKIHRMGIKICVKHLKIAQRPFGQVCERISTAWGKN